MVSSYNNVNSQQVQQNIPFWFDSINSVIDNLEAISGSTENDFLRIGKELNRYKGEIDTILAEALRISNIFTGDRIKESSEKMELYLTELTGYMNSSGKGQEENISVLNNVTSFLETADNELSGFKKIIKTLKMLSISTQIEAARMGSNDAGFNALADDVEKLSENINDKTSSIHNDTIQLKTFITSVIANNIQLGVRQSQQTKESTEQISEQLNFLNEKNRESAETALQISSNGEGIKKELNEIVRAIQFHDITHQQLEHVITSLNDLKEKSNYSFSDEEEVIKHAALLRDILKLESHQLNGSVEKFSEAVMTIKNELLSLLTNVGIISDETSKFLSSNSKGENFLDNMSTSLEHTIEIINDNNKISEELLESMNSVSETVKKLSDYVKLIEEIGEEVELIALNASVKAAHTGNEGAALGVIADAIQKLSSDALEQTRIVANPLKEISVLAETLKLDTIKEGESKIDFIATELSGLLKNIKHESETIIASINNIGSSFEKLHRDIELNINEFNIEKKVATVVNNVTRELLSISDAISNLIGRETYSDNEDILEKLEKRYTMLSEREIHHSFKTGKTISKKNQAKQEVYSYSDENLGDNVELF